MLDRFPNDFQKRFPENRDKPSLEKAISEINVLLKEIGPPLPLGKRQAETYDEGKEPLAHLPWAAITELSKVQQYGQIKYKDFNNYRKGLEISRNISCALRHIRDFMDGHDSDAESGINPLAHAICRLAFILQNIKDGVAIDDRYKK